MAETIDWPPPRKPPRRGRLLLLAVVALIVIGAGAALSYYVDALWFGSLGYADVFWKTLNLRAQIFTGFFLVTFLVLYGSYLLLKPARLGELAGLPILINGQPIKLPVEPVLRLIAAAGALVVAAGTGTAMMADWQLFAVYWHAPAASGAVDPIFGRPLTFFLFTLPVWQLVSGWLMTLAVMVCAVAGFFVAISGGTRMLTRGRSDSGVGAWRGLSIGFAAVTYTDDHVTLTGLLVVAGALVAGALIALVNAVSKPRLRWLGAAVVPAIVCYVLVGIFGWYVGNFMVKPNELVREGPYIAHNIQMTREAYGLNRIVQQPFPAETSVEAADAAHNQATLQNIRLWDWRALQDTLRQIQEIRTYYDFPDIDIDRYEIDGSLRQMMLAVRELNVDKLPESSRNWINEKLIYTHGYGVTMNPVNEFTPEGLPNLLLKNMPVESTTP